MRRCLVVLVGMALATAGCVDSDDSYQPVFAIGTDDYVTDLIFDTETGELLYDGRPPPHHLFVWLPPLELREVGDDSGDLLFSGSFIESRKGTLFISKSRETRQVNIDTGEYEVLDPGRSQIQEVVKAVDGKVVVVKDGAAFRWSSIMGEKLEPLTAPGVITGADPVGLAVNTEYFVAGRPRDGGGVTVDAWALGDLGATIPEANLVLDDGKFPRGALTEDNRYLALEDDVLWVWDIESGEVGQVESLNATRFVAVLENGLIVTSGMAEGASFDDPDAVNMTRFWDPETLTEVRQIRGLRILETAAMGDGRVAFAVELDDPERMRGEGATSHRVEVWDLDQIKQ